MQQVDEKAPRQPVHTALISRNLKEDRWWKRAQTINSYNSERVLTCTIMLLYARVSVSPHTMLLHHAQELDHHLRGRAEHDLTLAATLSIDDAHKRVVLRASVMLLKIYYVPEPRPGPLYA